MKNSHHIFVLIVFLSLAACATINNSSTLVGKWKLTETLADPGNGSGKWNSVTSESFITFNSDGTVNSTEFPSYRSYAILDSNKIEFASQNGTKQIVSYRRESAALILSPQCIEACGSKYIKVN